MRQYLKFYGYYAFFWMVYFAIARALFLCFQRVALTASASWSDIGGTFWHGAQMDASFTGYLLLLFAIIFALITPFSYTVVRPLVKWLSVPLLLVICIFTVGDAELFKHWGSRLDIAPFQYLTHPKEVVGGALPLGRMIFIILLMVAWSAVWIRIFIKRVMPFLPKKRLPWRGMPIFIVIAALCIIPIRGNFSTAPMNHGMVAFSHNTLINQATLNMPWNLTHALLHRDRIKSYHFMSTDEAQMLAKPYFTTVADTAIDNHQSSIINQPRPNVLIVILESWAARFVGCAGGEQGITPHFDALAREGVLFPHIYASGHRTERGLVAVLSGYPSQSGMPIISINSKMQKLPALASDFLQQGYNTAFFYGGDISFVNMRSYVLEKGFKRYTAQNDFSKKQRNRWGAHDEFLYARMFAELDTMRKPFFAAALTMSNHEPYDVPMKPVIKGTSDDAMRNAAYYADRCLGNFVAQCKQQTWWDSTLIVFVGDHGKQVLPTDVRYDTATIRIPMLWLGGALDSTAKRVDKIASQHDIAATLLRQLSMPTEHYRFSRNIMDTAQIPFAMHIFNDGFTFVTDSTAVIFDNNIHRTVLYDADSTTLRKAKAIFQIMNNEK
ncbi:sulfatase [Bacteroidia bacterium]|nr:sulfatase [Bacteroidia bacterium]